MEGRGTAVAFFLILGIICAGLYWSVQALRQGGTLISLGGTEEVGGSPAPLTVAGPSVTPLVLPPTETPLFVPPTPAPATVTPTATPTPQPPISIEIPTVAATEPAGASPTVAGGTNTPSATPAESPTPEATATETPIPASPTPSLPFQIARQQPDFERGCNGHYIYGTVRDASGAPLPGVRLHAYDLYGNDLGIVETKVDPAGSYDFVISPVRDVWTVEVVDESGRPISPRAEVLNTGGFKPGEEACWHRVDWVRR